PKSILASIMTYHHLSSLPPHHLPSSSLAYLLSLSWTHGCWWVLVSLCWQRALRALLPRHHPSSLLHVSCYQDAQNVSCCETNHLQHRRQVLPALPFSASASPWQMN